MVLKIAEFLKQHPEDWKTLLTAKPYCLKIDEYSECGQDYVLFKYDQIESDMKEDIARECRGIIFRKPDWKLMCFPFVKFWNYGDVLADKIDWNTARVQEKVDGSIIKVWDTGTHGWMISTNGKINANDATCPMGNDFMNLFFEGLREHVGNGEGKNNPAGEQKFFDTINKHIVEGKRYTYMFEMVHPLTRVVIRYEKPDIRHIGTRDNDTLEEVNIDLGIAKPKEYKFNSIEDAVSMAQTLPYSEEGYVVVDGNWNRVKVKSPSYVAVHHLKNNGVVTYKRIMELVMKNETEEFLRYFPEFTEYFTKAESAYNKFLAQVEKDLKAIEGVDFPTRKDYALTVTKMASPDFMFKLYDKKFKPEQFKEYLFGGGAERVVKVLGLKDEKAEDKKTVVDI